jgi:hypothetical protein
MIVFIALIFGIVVGFVFGAVGMYLGLKMQDRSW